MPEPTYIALWIDPDVEGLLRAFQEPFQRTGWRIEKSGNFEDGLRRLTYDDPQVDLILVDAQTIGDKGVAKYSILERIRQMDPDVPIVVVTDDPQSDLHFAGGRANALVFDKKELNSNPDASIARLLELIKPSLHRISSYDIEQRELANHVAGTYEALEVDRPGTVAYWLFEEDLIRTIVAERERRTLNRPLNILDIGCGTGRFARVILESSTTARVTCVDFSGQMLFEASKRLEEYSKAGRCTLNRALAEKLPDDYKEFDLVILGFGFPCYTPTRLVLKEVSRVIRDDGLLFASVYNHRALAYDRWTGPAHEDDPQRPISTWIDREVGLIWIPVKDGTPQKLHARTYTTGQFARELRQSGFQVGGYLSFPVLYSLFSSSVIEQSAEKEDREKCYGNSRFSFSLYHSDCELIRHLKDSGFYSMFLASKSKEPLTDLASSLHLHQVEPLQP